MAAAVDYRALERRLQHTFTDAALLTRALTHRSVPGKNNERLEFLGDAILGLVMAAELFRLQPDAKEGELSRVRAILVRRESLVKIADQLTLGNFLYLGAGEQHSGGSQQDSILANAVEAVIGAIYLDAGLDAAQACILAWYQHVFPDLAQLQPEKDAKTQLQEWLQARKLPLPVYQLQVKGKAHQQTFYVVCHVTGLDFTAKGESNSRRKAEQAAADAFLQRLKQENLG